MFPALPERTRWLRRLATPRPGSDELLATPAVVGGVDSSGSEVLPPLREGRRRQQIGRNGESHQRGSVGGNLGRWLTPLGLVGAWDWAGAQAPETAFPPLSEPGEEERSVLREAAFPAQEGAPLNLQRWERGLWNPRRLGATVRSRLKGGWHWKKVAQRTWAAWQPRLAFPLATFTLLVPWHGLKPDAHGFIHLSLAEFSL